MLYNNLIIQILHTSFKNDRTMCKAVEFLLINNEIRIVVGLFELYKQIDINRVFINFKFYNFDLTLFYYSRIEYTKSTKYIFKQANNFSAMFIVSNFVHMQTQFLQNSFLYETYCCMMFNFLELIV